MNDFTDAQRVQKILDGIAWRGIDPDIEAGSGEGYIFTYKDEQYVIECWATRNSGGRDIYDSEGVPANPFLEDLDDDIDDLFEERWDEKVNEFAEVFGNHYTELVRPAMHDAMQRALQEIQPDIDLKSSASVQHRIETGAYLLEGEAL